MKKFISIILINILLFSSIGLSTYSAATSDEYLTYELSTDEKVTDLNLEEKILCDATLEDDFEDDSVIVVFKNSTSKKLENHTRKSFSDISAKSVTDLTSRTKGKIEKQRAEKKRAANAYEFNVSATTDEMQVDENNFHQIVKIDLGVKSKENVLACVKKLEARDDVLMACPNYYFKPTGEVNPNDTCFPADYKYGGQWGSRLIDLPKAWYIIENSSVSTVKVGVLDSGIERGHEDLRAKYNSSLSKDFTGGNSPGTDLHGHGTQVAGIIGAEADNNIGVAGVCWDVSLVSLKISYYDEDGDFGTNFGIVANAIDYATDNNIPILNFSYCIGNEHDEELAPSWKNYPGLFVCSTTNDGINVTDTEFAHQEYNAANTIVVAATDKDDDLLVFYDKYGNKKGSSYSKTKVHLAAPGYDIWTTSIGNDYVCIYGTSMATPYVTGVAALLKSKYPTMDTEALKDYIIKGVDIIPELSDKVKTGGRLNAYNTFTSVHGYKVLYNPGDGGGTQMEITKATYGCETKLRKNTYANGYADFAGWYAYRASDKKWRYAKGTSRGWYKEGEQPSGYTKYLYSDEQSLWRMSKKDNDTITMYAQWKRTYTINFSSNNGTGSMSFMNISYNDTKPLSLNTFERNQNWEFDHWYAKRKLEDDSYALYYTDGTDGYWFRMSDKPNGYTRVDFADGMTINNSTFDDVYNGDVITMCAYWRPKTGVLGDANQDGKITVKDVTFIQNYINNQATITKNSHHWFLCDVTFDGNVTIKDATLISRYLSNLVDEFGE